MISAKVAQMISEMPAEIAGDLNFSTEEYQSRYKRVRSAMAEDEIDMLLVCGSSNYFNSYNSSLSYFTGPNIDAQLGVNHCIIPARGREALLTIKGSQLYAFLSTYPRIPIEPVASPPKEGTLNIPDHPTAVVDYLRTAGFKKGKIGISSLEICPTEIYLAITKAFPEAEIVDAFELVNKVRRVKSEEEITFLKRSAFIADVAITALLEFVRPGVSIKECLQVIENAMTAAGSTATTGLCRVGGGDFPNQMTRNYLRSPYRFKHGDIVTSLIISNYKGYHTQFTKPVSLGSAPNKAFIEFERVNKIIYETLVAKFRPGAKVRSELDQISIDLARKISNGVWGCLLATQTTDFEQRFYQEDIALEPGISYIVMPLSCEAKNWKTDSFFPPMENWIGHAWGNSLICTEDEPIVLHQTPLGTVIKTEFDEILKVPELDTEPTENALGSWKISFFLQLFGAQEKEMKVSEEGAFVDGNPVPFSFDDGSVAFKLTIGTLRGPMELAFKGWMIGNEIAGAFNIKGAKENGQRNRFKAVR